jgi:hypothetical protein
MPKAAVPWPEPVPAPGTSNVVKVAFSLAVPRRKKEAEGKNSRSGETPAAKG